MNLFDFFVGVEKTEELDMSRMLILMGILSGRTNKRIKGITKVVKLDFLLRYPVYLERSLNQKKIKSNKLEIDEYERHCNESKMIRYRYGPWDPKYHEYINILAAKGLLKITKENRTVYIQITDKGKKISKELSDMSVFQKYTRRSIVLKTHFDISGDNLKKFIYGTFPEITSLKMGEKIE